MGASKWLRRGMGVLVGLSPAVLMFLLQPAQFGNCARAWYLSAACLGVVPCAILFMGAVSTFFTTDSAESRNFALGAILGMVALVVMFALGFLTDTAPPGVPTTPYCHDNSTPAGR
ncbi:hypothetical protein [Catellatospora sp. NPDC049133]|uniref:hypothetical protein n=1 Tax=Catellatospora sp. NPDC049133 TaxID=3155499 RepID=UPI0034018018